MHFFFVAQIDFYERAKRLEEIPLLKQSFEEQRIKDMELWELQEEERVGDIICKHYFYYFPSSLLCFEDFVYS